MEGNANFGEKTMSHRQKASEIKRLEEKKEEKAHG